MTEQTTLSEYRAGQLNVLEILENFLKQQRVRGRQYFTVEQIEGIIRSVRLNLGDKFK